MKNNPALFNHRFQVISNYPSGPDIGTILMASSQGDTFIGTDYPKINYSEFPHIFRHMAWWELRPFEMMPLYVEKIKAGGYHRIGDILKVNWHIINPEKGQSFWQAFVGLNSRYAKDGAHQYNANELYPATPEKLAGAKIFD